MANICALCKKQVGFFTQITIQNGYLCSKCKDTLAVSNLSTLTVKSVVERYAYLQENQKLGDHFKETNQISPYFKMDENNKLFKIQGFPDYFPFSSLVNFELVEDGEMLTSGGLGRAAAGGVLFGGVGAIVGGITGSKKTKKVIKEYFIRLTLNDEWNKNIKITMLDSETKQGGFLHKTAQSNAREILSSLELISHQAELDKQSALQTPIHTPAAEILQYKQLLDMGAISECEYNQKKKQLLGL